MTTYQNGEIVRAALTSQVVSDPELGPAIEVFTSGRHILLPLSVADVDRVAPARKPRPGEIWSTGGGGLWFATRYYADFDSPADFEGCNQQGWKVLMVPLDGGPHGSNPGTPVEIHQRHGLVKCVHGQPVCECQDTDGVGNTMHTRSCPQWPTCDCPVDDQDVTHHLPDCAPGR